MIKKIAIIGGGPGGYVTAIKAAQSGFETHLIEKAELGGTCLNVGCIPTKALLHASEYYETIKSNSVPGISVQEVKFDWEAVQKSKNTIVKNLTSGVKSLLNANKVNLHTGKAELISNKKIMIAGGDEIEVDVIILATGSSPAELKLPGAELSEVLNSTQALSIEKVPESIVIIGGGVIGVELGFMFSDFGSKVSIVEMMEEILPPVDRQVSSAMHQTLDAKGIDIFTKSQVNTIEKNPDGSVKLTGENSSGIFNIDAEKVLLAAGRRPDNDLENLQKIGIKINRGAITVDDNFETSVKGIFAIGDCNAQTMLAHAASAQGEAVIQYLTAGKHHYNRMNIPSCVYTRPEIASVGLTEEKAEEMKIPYKKGIFNLSANGKAMIEGTASGFIKILADAETEEILGAHILGPRATDIIGEIVIAIEAECCVDDIIRTVHAHPTVYEAIAEAAMDVFGMPIHWPPSAGK